MTPTLHALGIDKMSIEERIALATAIWESIAAEPHPPLLTDAQRQELDRRLEEMQTGQVKGIPAAEVLARLRERYP